MLNEEKSWRLERECGGSVICEERDIIVRIIYTVTQVLEKLMVIYSIHEKNSKVKCVV